MSSKALPEARPVTRFSPPVPTPRYSHDGASPAISLVVVGYDMPEQLNRTLFSLSTRYQHGVEAGHYEVLVVENNSANNLGEERACAHGPNYRYFLRDESEPTPIHALNFGVAQARSEFVAVMIDGARMLTPGAVGWTLAATGLHPNPVVCIPGYHLGAELQQLAMTRGYDEAQEARLLKSISWPDDGYRLFEISCAAGTSAGGFFKPIGESNCLALRRTLFDELGGFDAGFRSRGGGLVNMDFYKRAVESAGTQLFLLHGEGSFHQFHGGETTGRASEDFDARVEEMAWEYVNLRGERFSPPEQRPVFLGAVADGALPFVKSAVDMAAPFLNPAKP